MKHDINDPEFRAFRIKLIKESAERVRKQNEYKRRKEEFLEALTWQEPEAYDILGVSLKTSDLNVEQE